MTETSRQRFGELEGYEIFRVERKDLEGNVTACSYEVLTPEGEFLDRFGSIDEAMRLVKSLVGIPLETDDFDPC